MASVLATPRTVIQPKKQKEPAVVKPPVLRDIGDSVATRTNIYDGVLQAARGIEPMTNKRHTLRLANVDYADEGDFSLADQKEAILGGKTLTRKLRGTWELVDNDTGGIVEAKKATIANVPYFTSRGTMIHNGNEYTLSNQMRMRPGIYTRIKDNGEIESHANILPGKGVAHRYFLNPEKGVFNVRIGQAKIPLMPMLRALGATDRQLREAWKTEADPSGNMLFQSNAVKDDPAALNKLYQRLVRDADSEAPAESKQQAVAKALQTMEMDPEVNRRTLGQPFDRVSLDSILATTKKLLAVSEGREDVDDRDHLAFQTIMGPEDLFTERIAKDYGGLRRQLFRRASMHGNLRHVQPGALSKQLQAAILHSGLGQSLEEINPADIFDKQGRISRLGEGGIPSIDSVPDEARSVQPSHLAFMDPVRTPESFKVGVDVHIANTVRKGNDGRLYAPFTDAKTGETVYRSPQDISELTIAFPKSMNSKAKRVAAMRNSQLGYYPRSEVDLLVPNFENAFSPLGAMVPMKSSVKAQRMAMASRMFTQALPLENPEAPLVQSGMPQLRDGKERSFEQEYGSQMGAIFAKRGGRVLSTNDGRIQVRYNDGTTEEIEGYNNFPYNRKTYIHNTPTVRPGDTFEPGQVLARSNYTDETGTTALGKNARVAYVPFGGKNFEDAIVVSESFAKRMSSEHMYQHSLDKSDEHKTSKSDFVGIFPGKFNRDTLGRMDDDGVVKEGTEINFGDPLILAARQKAQSRSKVHKKRAPSFADATLTWEHHSPGVVTDVFKSTKGTTVLVKSLSEMQEGDKLSGRYGDKGVIAAIVPDGQMPQAETGEPYEVLLNPLGIISRTNPAQMVEAALGKIAAKTGQPFRVRDFEDIDDLTEYAEQQLEKHGLQSQETIIDPETGRAIKDIATGNRFFMKLHHTAEGKGQGRGTGGYTMEDTPAKGGETGCFVGSQHVMTAFGKVGIANICEKRISIPVLTYCEQQQDWVYRPITDWFTYRSPVSGVLKIFVNGPTFENHGRGLGQLTQHVIQPTKQHVFYRFDGGEVLAGDLKVGDELATWGVNPSQLQKEFLLGTLLGDAYLSEAGFHVEHSVKQAKFVAWKQSVISGLGARSHDVTKQETSIQVRGETWRIKSRRAKRLEFSNHYCTELRQLCYPDGKKRVSPEWLSQLSGFSIAVWLLDDGTVTSKGFIRNRPRQLDYAKFSGAICTQGFEPEEAELLSTWLSTQYDAKCSASNADNRINVSTRMWRKLIAEIARWVPWQAIPKSKGTLRGWVKKIQKLQPSAETTTANRLERVPMRVVKIEPYVAPKGEEEITVYDFTVDETNKYCAGPALVSNSKVISLMDNNALLSHGSTEVARDAGAIRGQRNEEFWLPFLQGHNPPPPRVPLVYQKFVNQLRGAGINVVQDGMQTNIMAMTDKDVKTMAGNRIITSGETVKFEKGMEPVKGGLFDEKLTGGHNGSRWAKIPLAEPMPNPVMEEPIRRILGLTGKQFESVLAGKEQLGSYGTGPKGITKALERINIDKAIETARAQIKSGRKTARDSAVRRLGYLKSAKKLGIQPKDWMLNSVPVLPPKFRPVSVMSDKRIPLVSDANYLYKELLDANDNLKELAKEVDDVSDERLAVYNSFKAVTGLGDPVHPKLKEKKVRGLLKQVFGNSPKLGTLQRRLLSSTVDIVGRAVITPNPDLDMDHVGLPENRAWDIYRNFVVRRLKRRGMPLNRALQAVQDRSPLARREMLQEMEARPVIINRAPVLHRFGIMAFYPKLTKSDTLQVSPLVVGGFNADFDGDAMQYHVPVSDEAVAEAQEKMLPSRNLLSPADFKRPMHKPSQEYTGGLYAASTARSRRPKRTFRNLKDAVAAYHRGELNVDDDIEILS